MRSLRQRASASSRCSSRGRLVIVAARKARSAKQVACNRTLTAKQGHENDVAKLAAQILEWSEAEASSKGITAFQCVRDGWEPQTFHFWERYETAEAWGKHSASPRMTELMHELVPHLERPVGISLYSYEDGRLGPVCIQEGPKGEGGLDDATGASGAAGGASYKQTSRAFDLTKVDEHEENARDERLLAAMGGTAAGAGAAGAPTTPGGKAQPAGRGSKAQGKGPGLAGGLPSPAELVRMACGVKDSIISSLRGMMRK